MYLPIKIEDDGFVVRYAFRDDSGNDYMVQFKNDCVIGGGRRILGKSYEMAYYSKNEEGVWDARVVVNSGSPFRIMEAVFGKALRMFLRENGWIRSIWMEGIAKEGEKRGVTQRTRLYARHLEKDPVKGFIIRIDGNRIELIKKNR
jgi:hypothetical protein